MPGGWPTRQSPQPSHGIAYNLTQFTDISTPVHYDSLKESNTPLQQNKTYHIHHISEALAVLGFSLDTDKLIITKPPDIEQDIEIMA